MNKIVREIVREIRKNIDERYRAGAMEYFKEGIIMYGARLPVVRRISARYYKHVQNLTRKEIYSLCEQLLAIGYSEPRTIAFDWAHRQKPFYKAADFSVFESWLKKYVSNWGAVDDLCRHTLGEFVLRYPHCVRRLKKWTTSPNRWLRRAAAVVLITSVREGVHLDAAFTITDRLLKDDDYLVQNGYGWLLKDASLKFPRQVYAYIIKNKRVMPRRALRYALERYSKKLRKRAMAG